jgi:acyl-CoA thioesterase I
MSVSYLRALIMGDSLTWGSVASTPNTAFPWLIITGLRARGQNEPYFYISWGSPGITTSGAIGDLQEMTIAPTVDLIVLQLGTNDWGQNIAPATFQAQYVALLGLLRASSPNALLVGLTCWQDPATLNGAGEAVSLYNSIILDALTNHSGVTGGHACVDVASLYLTAAYHNTSGDLYHPNDAGHAAIANAILAAI